MHFCTVGKGIRSFNRIGLKTMSKMVKITPGWLAPSFGRLHHRKGGRWFTLCGSIAAAKVNMPCVFH
jgi:hypothetical protein